VAVEGGHFGDVYGVASVPQSALESRQRATGGMPPSQRFVTVGHDKQVLLWDAAAAEPRPDDDDADDEDEEDEEDHGYDGGGGSRSRGGARSRRGAGGGGAARGALVAAASVLYPAQCCAVCAVSQVVAVGQLGGFVSVFRLKGLALEVTKRICDPRRVAGAVPELQPKRTNDPTAAVSCLAFSPNGLFLAASTHERHVDVFGVSKADGWRRLHRCNGHSSHVVHFDWDLDSKIIQSNCR
jgi:WD40 repeat protein